MRSKVSHGISNTRSLVTHFRVGEHSAAMLSKKTLLGVSRALLVLAFLAMVMTPCTAMNEQKFDMDEQGTSNSPAPKKKLQKKPFWKFIFGSKTFLLTMGLVCLGVLSVIFSGAWGLDSCGGVEKFGNNIFDDKGSSQYLRCVVCFSTFSFAILTGGLSVRRYYTARGDIKCKQEMMTSERYTDWKSEEDGLKVRKSENIFFRVFCWVAIIGIIVGGILCGIAGNNVSNWMMWVTLGVGLLSAGTGIWKLRGLVKGYETKILEFQKKNRWHSNKLKVRSNDLTFQLSMPAVLLQMMLVFLRRDA